jgi:ribosomal protein L17
MLNTPFFPALVHSLAPMGARTAAAAAKVRAQTLCQLEKCFAPWLPDDLFPKAQAGQNSRDQDYTRWRTFWCMLWQALNPAASGREVVRQLQALFDLENGPKLSESDSAYCQAKDRLPLAQFPLALRATAQQADRLVPAPKALQGRPVKVVDGSTFAAQDTPRNRAAYPPIEPTQTPTFPLVRCVVLFSLLSGSLLAVAQGAWEISELALLHALAGDLAVGDIIIGDRGFGSFPVIAWLHHCLKVDFIGRTTRRIDGRRRIKRLARNDWLVRWQKSASAKSPWLNAPELASLPKEMTLRAVKGSCHRKGFRVRQLTVLTTLLDPKLYPAQAILEAYLRRWRLEMCLDDLKTTLHMEFLRSRSPEMVQKEMYARLIAHNLIRCTMAKAAAEHHQPLERISFKGSIDALRHFTYAMSQARSKAKRQRLWDSLLETLAKDLVRERPGRREPRAIKRKKNKYPRLDAPRHRFVDHPKRTVRAKNARLRKLNLI